MAAAVEYINVGFGDPTDVCDALVEIGRSGLMQTHASCD